MKRAQVGVREIRQYLSVYLDRVKQGETLEVTERGRPVAVLAPLPDSLSPLQRLVAEGRARRATEARRPLLPAVAVKLARPSAELLEQLRSDHA
jgi:prevent-host-death family protein